MSDKKLYEIKHCDVYEILPGCKVNKTLPLRLQIEVLYCLAGKDIKVKIVNNDDYKNANAIMQEHLEKYHKDEKPLVKCPKCHVWVKMLWMPFNLDHDLDSTAQCMLCTKTARREKQ